MAYNERHKVQDSREFAVVFIMQTATLGKCTM